MARNGLDFSRSATFPSVFFFVPQNLTSGIANAFAQDDISIVPNVFDVIAGAKVEHNIYTGFEFQPTVRARWRPSSAEARFSAGCSLPSTTT